MTEGVVFKETPLGVLFFDAIGYFINFFERFDVKFDLKPSICTIICLKGQ